FVACRFPPLASDLPLTWHSITWIRQPWPHNSLLPLSDPGQARFPGSTAVDVVVRELSGLHVNDDFLETLASLREVQLTISQATEVFRSRLRAGIRTYIALADDR